jgi:hypothetical protein
VVKRLKLYPMLLPLGGEIRGEGRYELREDSLTGNCPKLAPLSMSRLHPTSLESEESFKEVVKKGMGSVAAVRESFGVLYRCNIS